MVDLASELVGHAVVAHIYHQIKVAASYGFLYDALGFPRTEAGNGGVYQIGILLVSLKSNGVFVLQRAFLAPLYQIIVTFCASSLQLGRGMIPREPTGIVSKTRSLR